MTRFTIIVSEKNKATFYFFPAEGIENIQLAEIVNEGVSTKMKSIDSVVINDWIKQHETNGKKD